MNKPNSVLLRTSQNIEINYPLAAVGSRFGAYLMDSLFFFICYFLLFFLFRKNIFALGEQSLQRLATIFPLLLFVAVKSILEAKTQWQTPGKRIANIRIVRLDQQPLTLKDTFLRNILLLLEGPLTLFLLAILVITPNKRNQRLGDIMALTVVLGSDRDLKAHFDLEQIVNINKNFTNSITYKQAGLLYEEDMLMMKQLLLEYEQTNKPLTLQLINTLAQRTANLLDISPVPDNSSVFLKQLLNDYIMITRN